MTKFYEMGVTPQTSDEEKERHKFLILMGSLMSIGGLLWGSISLYFELWQAAMIPYGYTIVTVLNFLAFRFSKNFKLTQTIQVSISLLLPFMFQWLLGGFVSSGAIMLWAMMALTGAMTFSRLKTAGWWLVMYLILVIISSLADGYFRQYTLDMPQSTNTLFFALNIGIVSAAVFGLFMFFKFRLELLIKSEKEKQEQLEAREIQLKTTYEELLASEEELRQNSEELLAMNESITARNKEVESAYTLLEQQKEELETLSLVAEKVSNGVIITNAEGLTEWINQGFTNISGYQLKDLKGKKPGDVLQGEETDPNTVQKIREGLEMKVPFSVEILNYHRLGLPYWINLQVTPILNEKGEVERFLSVQSDVSERKNTERRTQKQNQELIAFKEELSEAYAFQSSLFNSASALIMATDSEGIITKFNKTAENSLGYQAQELEGKYSPSVLYNKTDLMDMMAKAQEEGIEVTNDFSIFIGKLKKANGVCSHEANLMTKDGKAIPFAISISEVQDDEKNPLGYVLVGEDISERKEIERQKEEISEKIRIRNQNVTASLNYAKRIQSAILPTKEQMNELLPAHFVLFKPKDIVSGDFYWITTHSDKTLIAAVDCTGHGVPGAFMSLIGNTLLTKIVSEYGVTEPHEILELLHLEINETLRQNEEKGGHDGMDMAICSIDGKNRIIEFAGAGNPIYIIQDGELVVLKGNRHGVGGVRRKKMEGFVKKTFQYKPNTQVYMFSDGPQDQFGGEGGREKFGRKRIQQILLKNSSLTMEQQKEELEEELLDWQGDSKQIDDMLLLGFQLR